MFGLEAICIHIHGNEVSNDNASGVTAIQPLHTVALHMHTAVCRISGMNAQQRCETSASLVGMC